MISVSGFLKQPGLGINDVKSLEQRYLHFLEEQISQFALCHKVDES